MKEKVTKKVGISKNCRILQLYIKRIAETEQSIKMTPVAAVKWVKHDIALSRTVSVRYGLGGSKIWI